MTLSRWVSRMFFPQPAIDFGPLLVLRATDRWHAMPLPFLRWRDGRVVWPDVEMGFPMRSDPIPWKLGHGRDGERWEDRR